MNSSVYALSVPFYFASLKVELQPSFLRSCFCALTPSLLIDLFHLEERLLNEFTSHPLTTELPGPCTGAPAGAGSVPADRLALRDAGGGGIRLPPPAAIPRHDRPRPAAGSRTPCSGGVCSPLGTVRREKGGNPGPLAPTASCCFSQR